MPGFGDNSASLMIVGLAPAAHGGNRTGRVFTGDPSARFLMEALHEAGFANQPTSEHKDDGLKLNDAYICGAVRCVPPQDMPTSDEQHNCLPYLKAEMEILTTIKAILALGHLAFGACVRALGQRAGQSFKYSFGHCGKYKLHASLPILFASYHPSPRNTNTGRLSMESLVSLLTGIKNSFDR